MTYVYVPNVTGDIEKVHVEELSWRPSAYAVVVQDGSFLAIQYKDGRYDLPGGGIEFGEMIEETVIRETKEETGFDVANPRLLSAQSTFFRTSGNDTNCQTIMMYYMCDFVGGEVSQEGFDSFEQGHIQSAGWIPLSSLPEIEVASTVDWRQIVAQHA